MSDPIDSSVLNPQRGFSTAEFAQRTAGIQDSMAREGIDVLLFTTEPDVRYYSGFFTQFWQSPTRPWFLLVPVDGKPVAVIPGIGEACMRRTWIEDIRCWSSPHPTDDGVTLLADTIVELCGTHGRIGMPKGRETSLRMSLLDYEALLAKLDNRVVVDATGIVQAQRQVKSLAEIAKIARACQAASNAFAQLPSMVGVGDSEREIFRRFRQLCIDNGVDDVSYLVGAAGAGGYSDIISPPGDQQTADGDILILDTGCIFDGYFCDFDRNYAFTAVDKQTAEAYRITHESIDAALAMLRPGVTCSEIYHAMQAVLDPGAEAQVNNVGRMGHGLGTQLTESPSITAFDHTVMQEGMVMTLEPGLAYGAGKIMVHEENVVIRENGAELLSKRAAAQIMII